MRTLRVWALALFFGATGPLLAATPNAQMLVGVWYGTQVDPQVASSPLHWKLWRQSDGRFVIDYYVQAGCFLSYSHRESGLWTMRRGVNTVITEQIGERKLDRASKAYQQRYQIAAPSADRMRLAQRGEADLLLTRIPADFRMDTMNLCSGEL